MTLHTIDQRVQRVLTDRDRSVSHRVDLAVKMIADWTTFEQTAQRVSA